MRLSSEAEVVLSLKRHLLESGFQGGTVTDLVVDADASYMASGHARALEPIASVGILLGSGGAWSEALAAADPRPTPWGLETAVIALRGVPGARQLELSMNEALEAGWPDLSSPASRTHTVEGARTLCLLGVQGRADRRRAGGGGPALGRRIQPGAAVG
jgi:hypothetical protein